MAITKISLLLVLLLYLTSVNFFHHIHFVDGEIILHSHLHADDKETTPVHPHTSAELEMIQHLMTVEISEFALPIFSLPKFRDKAVTLLFELYTFKKKNVQRDSFFLRPPPVL